MFWSTLYVSDDYYFNLVKLMIFGKCKQSEILLHLNKTFKLQNFNFSINCKSDGVEYVRLKFKRYYYDESSLYSEFHNVSAMEVICLNTYL